VLLPLQHLPRRDGEPALLLHQARSSWVVVLFAAVVPYQPGSELAGDGPRTAPRSQEEDGLARSRVCRFGGCSSSDIFNDLDQCHDSSLLFVFVLRREEFPHVASSTLTRVLIEVPVGHQVVK
jgi:hypothetical protein